MFKEEITYKDYNNLERTETFYFKLTTSELQEMQASYPGGMSEHMASISARKDMPEMMKFFKELIMKSYGEKSPDGRRLMKQDGELAKAFVETPAYDIIFQKIFTEENGMIDFIVGIMPSDIAEKMRPEIRKMKENRLPAGA